MSDQPDVRADPAIPDDALLLLNRATLVAHAVRSTVHELNNVFQMIGGSAELVSAAGVPPAAAARLDVILNQTMRGQTMLQAVEGLTRYDRGAGATVDVATVADHALQMRKYENRRTAVAAILHRPASGATRVTIAPQLLLQAILNLLVNAEQALTGIPNGSIQLSLWSDDGHVDLTVADNGPGVPPDLDLLAPFVTTHGPSAAGLGLAASRLIARQAGGDLEAIASADGARWRLRLPAAPPSVA